MKRSQQSAAREHHTNQIRLKARRKAKELQEELAIDMKILETLLTETKNEAEETVKRKVGFLGNLDLVYKSRFGSLSFRCTMLFHVYVSCL